MDAVPSIVSRNMRSSALTTINRLVKSAKTTMNPASLQLRQHRSFVQKRHKAKKQICYLASTSIARPSDAMGDEYFNLDSRPVILFDGVCNMCNAGVNFMLDWDKQGFFRLAALQSPAGRKLLQRAGRSPDNISSIVLVTEDRAYIKSEAVLRIGQQLSMPLAMVAGLAFLVPKVPADYLYDQIANNRYGLFGYTSTCRLSDPRFEERFIMD